MFLITAGPVIITVAADGTIVGFSQRGGVLDDVCATLA
jgi:hypothetical protein